MNRIHNFKIFQTLLILIGLIIILHMLLSKWLVFNKPQSIFYVDNQINFSSHFGTVFAFLTGMIFLYISLYHGWKKIQYKKFVMGLFFLLLSYDEYIEIH